MASRGALGPQVQELFGLELSNNVERSTLQHVRMFDPIASSWQDDLAPPCCLDFKGQAADTVLAAARHHAVVTTSRRSFQEVRLLIPLYTSWIRRCSKSAPSL